MDAVLVGAQLATCLSFMSLSQMIPLCSLFFILATTSRKITLSLTKIHKTSQLLNIGVSVLGIGIKIFVNYKRLDHTILKTP
mgnify:CR=1 FL=1